MFLLVKYLILCSHIEFEDSEEEAGDTVVTGGLKIGQARSFSMYDIDEIFKCCESELKIEFNLFSNQAGRSGPIGWTQGKHQDANRRAHQLNFKVFLQLKFL